MGERAGNTKLAEVVRRALHDHGPFAHGRRRASARRHHPAGRDCSAARTSRRNAPIVGGDVFTQTAGIHADGDAKGDLYATELAPDRFGRERRYALGKLSGKASLDQNLKRLGIELSDQRPRPRAPADRRARRQEAHRRASRTCASSSPTCSRRPQTSWCGSSRTRCTVAMGGPPRASVVVDPPGRALRGGGIRRRRLRRLHERAQEGRAALRHRGAAAHGLPRAHPAGRPHQRAGRDPDPLARTRGRRRASPPWASTPTRSPPR